MVGGFGERIGIVSCILGRLLYDDSFLGETINIALYSCHMPMYFIISGYVLKNDDKPFLSYVKYEVRSLIVPVLIFVL